jgi:hypothetical protein
MQNPDDPASASRLLDSAASLTSDAGADARSQPVCDSCNWRVTQTRRFRGRMLCMPCIGEYFEADGEEDENQ